MNKILKYFVTLAAVVILTGCGVNKVLVTGCGENSGLIKPLPPSAAVSHHVSYNLINSHYILIGDLASKNSDGTDNQIMTKLDGQILVSAQVKIDNSGGIAVRGSCRLLISDGEGPSSDLTEIGRSAVWYTTNNAAYNLTVPVLAYATKPPGTSTCWWNANS